VHLCQHEINDYRLLIIDYLKKIVFATVRMIKSLGGLHYGEKLR